MIKKLPLLLALLVSSTIVSAQQRLELPSTTNYRPDALGINAPQPVTKSGVPTLLLTDINAPYTFIAFEYDEDYRIVNLEQTDPDYPEYNLKDEFEYENGNVTKIKYYSLLQINADWRYTSYEQFTYDDNDRKLTRINANDLGTGFLIGGEGFYSYNENGQLSEYLQLFNQFNDGSPFDSLSNTFYGYDEFNRLKSESVYFYNGDLGTWNFTDSSVYIYDELGRLTERLTYTLYDGETTWSHTFKTTWEYDDNSVYWVEQRQYLSTQNATTWATNPEQKYVLRYVDTDKEVLYPTEATIRPVIDNWFIQSNPGEAKKYILEEDFYATDMNTNNLTFIETAEYVYSEIDNNTGIKDNNLNVEIYPNPTTNFIIIDGIANAKVEIYNLQGKLAMVLPYVQGKQLNVSMLTTGTYIIKITTENGTASSKFVKK